MGLLKSCMALETHVFDRWCAPWLCFSLCIGFVILAVAMACCVGVTSSILALSLVGCWLSVFASGFLQGFGGRCCLQHNTWLSWRRFAVFRSFDQIQVSTSFDWCTLRILPRECKAPWCASKFRWLVCLVVMNSFRIGEASLPGPPPVGSADPCEWSLGICNPSGLPNKAHVFAQSNVNIWCVSESHLSKHGQRTFMKQLRGEQSHYQWCVSGWPVPPRSNVSFHGSWCGVAVISQHPTRAMPDEWPSEVVQSSRIVCATTFINSLWVSGVTVYGVPIGPTHPRAKAATSQLLAAAIDRLQCMEGPRYLAGDFNHDVESIPILQKLDAMRFVEVQTLWQARTGQHPQATCKGKTQRDYLYLSPELAALFIGVNIDPFKWADHATVVARFHGDGSSLVRYPWPCPQPLPWDQISGMPMCEEVPVLPSDSTEAYKVLWQSVETRVCESFLRQNKTIPVQCLGRAQRLERHTVVGYPAPPKKGRQGEFQPRFFGLSFLHAHRLKQVRRLQSYVRISGVKTLSPHHSEHCVSLWQSICRAPGFAPDFATWWSHRQFVVGDPAEVPFLPPGPRVAEAFLLAMQLEVRNLESRLKRGYIRKQAKNRSSGLSQLYASVRRDAPVPVDVLVENKQGIVKHVDDDLCALELCHPVAFDPALPIMCNGKPIRPIVVTDDKLFVEEVDEVQSGDLLCQTVCTGELDAIFEAFTSQWKQRWDKHEGVPASHWDSLFRFAQSRLGVIDVPGPCFSVEHVRAIASGKKSKAAIGLDGVSRRDVLGLTNPEVELILQLYDRAHNSGQWPQQMLQGQVKSLAKKERPGGVGDFRPITIFSFLYRIWSSVSSQHWLKHVSEILDSRLCGNRGGYRASHLWRAILDNVEDAHCTGQACGGVVFDLEKAFNTLPRVVCLGLAVLVGVDSHTTTAWAGALSNMTRCFLVRGSVSKPIGASCGFAEGCGMSCLAMLLLDQLWHEWVLAGTQMCTPMSYVDNWEVVVRDPALIDAVVASTFSLADQLDLVVDKKKSFTWATSAPFRRALRFQGHQVKLDTADLGAHVTYSQQLRNSSLLNRFHGLSDFWVKLRHAFGTHTQKAQVVLRAAWPRAMHAISASWVGFKHYHALRSAFMVALRLDRPGANSFAQLHCDGFLMDPHAYALLQTLRDHRDLGTSPWHTQLLAELVHGGMALPVGSVSQVLVNRLHYLKWAVLPDGQVTDAFGVFDLSSVNWSELCLRFQHSWHLIVSDALLHRWEFQGFEHVDEALTRSVLQDLPAYQQGICRCNLNGSTLTNQHAYHWSSSGTVACQFCQQDDSLFHRYWECPHSHDLRASIPPPILDLVPALPRACALRSWQLRSPLVFPWRSYLCSLPAGLPLSAVTLSGGGPIDFFTDGSCFHQECRTCRMAAWSVCLATPFHMTVNAGMDETTIVASGVLAGLVQTSFRAELMAVMAALHYGCTSGRSIRIWTDCLGVLRKFTTYIVGSGRVRVNSANADLWQRIGELVQQIGKDNIQLIKVKAHQSLSENATNLERWIHANNQAADGAAKSANFDRPTTVWALWEQLALQTSGLRTACATILQFQLKVCQRWSQEFDSGSAVPVPRVPRIRDRPQMEVCIEPERHHPPAISCKVLGMEHAKRMLDWWNNQVDRSTNELQWVSFAQLYILYQLDTSHPGAVRCSKRWVDPATSPVVLPERFAFRVRARWFRLQLQQLWKHCGWSAKTISTRPASEQLVCFLGCASLPIKSEGLMRVEQWLVDKSKPICGHGQGLDCLPPAW